VVDHVRLVGEPVDREQQVFGDGLAALFLPALLMRRRRSGR